MSLKKHKLIAADFETTVYKGQTKTEVWSAAYAELFTESVSVCHSLPEFFKELYAMNCSATIWFHNLRFDGSFIVDWLLRNGYNYNNVKTNDMNSKDFKCLISAQNRWYSVTVKHRNCTIEFRDSVKLMPFTLKQLGNAFKTKHQKLDMEYTGYRYAGCPITHEEMQYIINDVFVLKEALEVMINDGHDKLTIGSCCVDEFKKTIGTTDFDKWFPDLKEITLDKCFRWSNVDEYVRRSYHGGWCYLKKSYENKWISQGQTFDVNSLYPSVMHSKSGNYYPIGKPKFWKGEIPDEAKREGIVYFVRLRCRFELKEGFLPTIQIKRDFRYSPTEWLETSDVYYKGEYHRYFKDLNGEIKEAKPEMILTFRDYELLLAHYNVYDLEIIDGCWFYGIKGIFDEYIDKYMHIKENATGALRSEAKLFLNNLYGKLSSSDDSSYRVPYLDTDENHVDLEIVSEHEKRTFAIPAGSMVTAYARYFTITHAQKNYDKFIYADTDSLHCLNGEMVDINEHPSALLCWKKESEWSRAKFLRAKTYCEFIRVHDGLKVDRPYWDIKCAGMPDRCKDNFLATRPITDFNYGLKISGKLRPNRIEGGTILEETEYTLRKKG